MKRCNSSRPNKKFKKKAFEWFTKTMDYVNLFANVNGK